MVRYTERLGLLFVVVVEEIVRMAIGPIMDLILVRTVAEESTLLIFVGIYMENLLGLRIRLVIKMIPLLLLPYLGQLL